MENADTEYAQSLIGREMMFRAQSAQVLEKFGGPPRDRTEDPLIKSQLLYQLS